MVLEEWLDNKMNRKKSIWMYVQMNGDIKLAKVKRVKDDIFSFRNGTKEELIVVPKIEQQVGIFKENEEFPYSEPNIFKPINPYKHQNRTSRMMKACELLDEIEKVEKRRCL